MSRTILLTLSCLFIAIFSFAQIDSTSYAPTATENALLWKIEGKNLSTPSYLYGTIHLIPSEDFFLTDATKSAFAECKQITFEINMDDMMNMSTQLGLLMNAMMKDGTTLRDLLSEADYNVVDDHFKEMGLPLVFMERIKPMFLSVFASSDFDMLGSLNGTSDSTATSMMSYELELMEMAKVDSLKIGGLETAEYQMSMFDSIPYKAQAEMLVQAIQSESSDNGQLEQMIEIYKQQNLQAMVNMLSSEEEGIGEYEDILLETRNRNWIPVMEEQMAALPTFFAVGAGHLGGEIGVIALLRREGYTLTAINPVLPRP